MRARVFESEFQISFLTFSHNDDQNISSECKSWKAHFNKLVQKMDWFTGSRYQKVQVWAQGWLGVACLRLLSLHPLLLVNLAEGTGLFPWGSSKSVWAVTEWLPLTHMYSRTIFLARGYVLSSSSETPAPLGAVRWGHSSQESHGDVSGADKTMWASKKPEGSTPLTLTILTATSDTTEEFLACCQSCVCPLKTHKNTA